MMGESAAQLARKIATEITASLLILPHSIFSPLHLHPCTPCRDRAAAPSLKPAVEQIGIEEISSKAAPSLACVVTSEEEKRRPNPLAPDHYLPLHCRSHRVPWVPRSSVAGRSGVFICPGASVNALARKSWVVDIQFGPVSLRGFLFKVTTTVDSRRTVGGADACWQCA